MIEGADHFYTDHLDLTMDIIDDYLDEHLDDLYCPYWERRVPLG